MHENTRLTKLKQLRGMGARVRRGCEGVYLSDAMWSLLVDITGLGSVSRSVFIYQLLFFRKVMVG